MLKNIVKNAFAGIGLITWALLLVALATTPGHNSYGYVYPAQYFVQIFAAMIYGLFLPITLICLVLAVVYETYRSVHEWKRKVERGELKIQ